MSARAFRAWIITHVVLKELLSDDEVDISGHASAVVDPAVVVAGAEAEIGAAEARVSLFHKYDDRSSNADY